MKNAFNTFSCLEISRGGDSLISEFTHWDYSKSNWLSDDDDNEVKYKAIGKVYRYTNYREEVRKNVYNIISETKCGYWIDVDHRPKWIGKNSYKGFARTDEEAALISFIARKNKQIRILENQMEDTETALRKAKSILLKTSKPVSRLEDWTIEWEADEWK